MDYKTNFEKLREEEERLKEMEIRARAKVNAYRNRKDVVFAKKAKTIMKEIQRQNLVDVDNIDLIIASIWYVTNHNMESKVKAAYESHIQDMRAAQQEPSIEM